MALSPTGFPDSAILCKVARVSEARNETTAECHTAEGQAVEVSFWLVDPPGMSYFSVNCPGIKHTYDAWLVCAEDAFVLFSLNFWAPPASSSTQPAPNPNCDCSQTPTLQTSAGGNLASCPAATASTMPWPSSTATGPLKTMLVGLMPMSSRLKHRHGPAGRRPYQTPLTCPCVLGIPCSSRSGLEEARWAGSTRGVASSCSTTCLAGILTSELSHYPLIVGFADPTKREDTYFAPEYFYNVACCDHLIKFVQVKYDDPDVMTAGSGWKATMWDFNVSGKDWCDRYTVDVANISVDKRFSATLPELWDDETRQLQLKKLIFYGPMLSMLNGDLLYMMAKVNDEDAKAWAITIDMKHEALKALAQFSVEPYQLLNTVCCSHVFPKYLNIPPDLFLDCDLSTYKESKELLIECCPVSSLCVNIDALLKYATCTDEASNDMQHVLRAFEGFEILLTESFNEKASDEILRSKIIMALPILDKLLQTMFPKAIPEGKYEGVEIFEQYEKSAYIKNDDQSSGSTAENVCDCKKRNRAKKRTHKQQQEICKPSNLNGWLRYLMGCILMSIGMLVLRWMALVTFEAWTEPATSNLILRSFGTKLGAIYKILLGQRI